MRKLDDAGRPLAPAELARALAWRSLDVRNRLRRLVSSRWVTPKRRPGLKRERFTYVPGPAFRAYDRRQRDRVARGNRARTPRDLHPATVRKVALLASAMVQLCTLDVSELARGLEAAGVPRKFIVPRVRRAALRKADPAKLGASELAVILSTRLG